MSYRGEPQTLGGVISQTVDTVRQQSRGNTGVKQQNVRIGDQLISEGTDDNTLVVTDLGSGSSFTLPQDIPEPVVESGSVFWPFNLIINPSGGFGGNRQIAGPWIAQQDVQITNIVCTVDAQNSVLWSPTTITYTARYGAAPYSSYNTSINIQSLGLGPIPGTGAQIFVREINAQVGWFGGSDNGTRTLQEDDAIGFFVSFTSPSLTNTQIIGSVTMYYEII